MMMWPLGDAPMALHEPWLLDRCFGLVMEQQQLSLLRVRRPIKITRVNEAAHVALQLIQVDDVVLGAAVVTGTRRRHEMRRRRLLRRQLLHIVVRHRRGGRFAAGPEIGQARGCERAVRALVVVVMDLGSGGWRFWGNSWSFLLEFKW